MAKHCQKKRLPVNYVIKHIIDSIIQDIPAAHRHTEDQKRRLYEASLQVFDRYPRLKQVATVSHIHNYPIEGGRFFTRVGVLPTQLVIADERFQNLCCMPYWTVYNGGKGQVYRRFDRCPGYGRLPGCPPQAITTAEVQRLLHRSTHILVLQTTLLQERWNVKWKFDVLYALAADIEEVCGKESVISVFGSGPCSACSEQYCLHHRPCKAPHRRTISLEAAGICVDRMCSDLAVLTGNNAWKLSWIRHFGLPEQRPKFWKYVEAIVLRLT
ncbi:MAG: DUF2284 domain-containing protein [Desulfobacterota bacterium]|nr:DUF2284 domain-containing protein [Thermodesulfobacteriota bacterium]